MPTPHPGRPLILIAERDPQVRKLQHYFLDRAGYELRFADDGEEGLELARTLPCALVVTEILIPRLDGLSLCRRLRADEATRAIPLLVFSILAAGVRAHEAGADAFLRKPFVDSIFVPAVQQLIVTGTTRAEEGQ